MKIDVNLEVSEEHLSDVLITAFDGSVGGSWYWAAPGDPDWLTTDDEGRWTGVLVVDREDPDDDEWVVNWATVVSGMERIVSGEVGIRRDLRQQVVNSVTDPENFDIDADAADCIVQAGLFNELVYG